MEARKWQFLNLVQGNLSMADYELEFVQLSQYVYNMVLSKKDRYKRFWFSLNRETWVYLVAQSTEIFDEFVEKDKVVVETLAEPPCSVMTKLGKRAFNGISRRPPKKWCDTQSSARGFRRRFRPSQYKKKSSVVVSTSGSSGGFGWPLCVHYERRHPEVFRKFTSLCFKCVYKEHLLRDCPNRVEVSQTQSSAPASMPTKGCGHGRGKGDRLGSKLLLILLLLRSSLEVQFKFLMLGKYRIRILSTLLQVLSLCSLLHYSFWLILVLRIRISWVNWWCKSQC